jgi:hypothetical protein
MVIVNTAPGLLGQCSILFLAENNFKWGKEGLGKVRKGFLLFLAASLFLSLIKKILSLIFYIFTVCVYLIQVFQGCL